MDVVFGPLGARQPFYLSLPSPALEVSRPIVHLLGFRASPKIPTSDVCLRHQAGSKFGFKIVGFSFKMVGFSFKIVDFNFKMVSFSFEMVRFSFKMVGLSCKMVVLAAKWPVLASKWSVLASKWPFVASSWRVEGARVEGFPTPGLGYLPS